DVDLLPLFEWETVEFADSYSLRIATDEEFNTVSQTIENIEEPEFQLTVELESEITYYWSVRATEGENSGDWSSPRSFVTFVAEPDQVMLDSPVNAATGIALQPTLDWNAADGATSYDLQVSTDNSFSTLTVDETDLTELEFEVTATL